MLVNTSTVVTPNHVSGQSDRFTQVFGHTHHNVDFVAENGCWVVSNQRGYPRDAMLKDNGFRPGLVIEL